MSQDMEVTVKTFFGPQIKGQPDAAAMFEDWVQTTAKPADASVAFTVKRRAGDKTFVDEDQSSIKFETISTPAKLVKFVTTKKDAMFLMVNAHGLGIPKSSPLLFGDGKDTWIDSAEVKQDIRNYATTKNIPVAKATEEYQKSRAASLFQLRDVLGGWIFSIFKGNEDQATSLMSKLKASVKAKYEAHFGCTPPTDSRCVEQKKRVQFERRLIGVPQTSGAQIIGALGDILAAVSESKAKKIFIFISSCFSGNIHVSPLWRKFARDARTKGKSVVIMTSSWPGVVSTGAGDYGLKALAGWSKNFDGWHGDFLPWIENGGAGITADTTIQMLREQVRRGIWTIGQSTHADVHLFASDAEMIQAELKKEEDRDGKLTVNVKLISKSSGFLYCSPPKPVTDESEFIMYGKGLGADTELKELKFKGIKETKDGAPVFASNGEKEFIMHVESGEDSIRSALPDTTTTVPIAIRCNPRAEYIAFPEAAASDDAIGITWPYAGEGMSRKTFNPITGTMVSTVNLGSVGTIGDLFLPTKG
eukprot:g928.t1